ncbi:MAG: CPBP family intramembrane glutamic endopeptidase [Candidatus Glassbacteria bacterium]
MREPTENKLTSKRERLAFIFAAFAIILRMASDWIFATGGPLPYQLLQAFFLFISILILRHDLEVIYLRGGQIRLSIKWGLLAIPLGFIFGLGDAFLSYGRPLWPDLPEFCFMAANNVFFSAVEELEFRGFLLLWLMRKKISPTLIILIVALVASLAHSHRFLEFDIRSIVITIAVNAYWTWIVYRTRCIWGAWVAHATWNIFVLLPILGTSNNIR